MQPPASGPTEIVTHRLAQDHVHPVALPQHIMQDAVNPLTRLAVHASDETTQAVVLPPRLPFPFPFHIPVLATQHQQAPAHVGRQHAGLPQSGDFVHDIPGPDDASRVLDDDIVELRPESGHQELGRVVRFVVNPFRAGLGRQRRFASVGRAGEDEERAVVQV